MRENGNAQGPQLGMWDGIGIIIGIVIGVGIFKAPLMVYSNVAGPWLGLGAWALGGVLALVGAFCYAELATTYPRSGGDYVYLTRAFGPFAGFLFGWAQLVVLYTGSIGVMAYAFADYAIHFWDMDSTLHLREEATRLLVQGKAAADPAVESALKTQAAALQVRASELTARMTDTWGFALAALSVIVFTALNLLGLIFGKIVQNTLSILKVIGLSAIVVIGFSAGRPYFGYASEGIDAQEMSFGFAMIMVLYTYGGWNDAAFVAADVRDQKKNIPRVLILGTGLVMFLYLLVNLGYLWGLGFEELRSTHTPASDLMLSVLGTWGGKLMSILVMVSALGAINGLILTGSRIYATMGEDHRVFSILSYWHPRLGVPVWSLVAQAVFTLLLATLVGTTHGREAMDIMAGFLSGQSIPWEKYGGRFETLVSGTAPVFWIFFLMTGLSIFVLRKKDAGIERPFTVPLYPLVPIVFCLTCVYMLYASLIWAQWLTMLGLLPLGLGVVLYWLTGGQEGKGKQTKMQAED